MYSLHVGRYRVYTCRHNGKTMWFRFNTPKKSSCLRHQCYINVLCPWPCPLISPPHYQVVVFCTDNQSATYIGAGPHTSNGKARLPYTSLTLTLYGQCVALLHHVCSYDAWMQPSPELHLCIMQTVRN